MIGIVLAGGKGSRMSVEEEKLLLPYKEPLIIHVAKALSESNCFSETIFLTSPNSPKTRDLLLKNNYKIFKTNGKGLVEDLNKVLQSSFDSVFIIPGDLPLVDSKILKKIVGLYDPNNIWTTILVTKKFLDSLGISSSYTTIFENQPCCYSGISLINANKITKLEKIEETYVILDDRRIAFNINTKQDYDLLRTT